jgi:hypothetical protein
MPQIDNRPELLNLPEPVTQRAGIIRIALPKLEQSVATSFRLDLTPEVVVNYEQRQDEKMSHLEPVERTDVQQGNPMLQMARKAVDEATRGDINV